MQEKPRVSRGLPGEHKLRGRGVAPSALTVTTRRASPQLPAELSCMPARHQGAHPPPMMQGCLLTCHTSPGASVPRIAKTPPKPATSAGRRPPGGSIKRAAGTHYCRRVFLCGSCLQLAVPGQEIRERAVNHPAARRVVSLGCF